MKNSNSKYLLPDLSSGRHINRQANKTEEEIDDFVIDMLCPTLPEHGPYTEFVIKPMVQNFSNFCWEMAGEHVMSQDFSAIIDEP